MYAYKRLVHFISLTMFLLLSFVLLLLYVIRYAVKIRRSRLYEVYRQYPPCFKELPVIGAIYHFLLDNTEDAMTLLMKLGYNTMKLGGISRVYGFKTFYVVLTDASDITEVLTKCLNKDSYLYRFIQTITGNGSIFTTESSTSKVRRRVIMPSYSPKMLSNYIEALWEESLNLTEVLAPFVGKGPFVAGQYLGAFCFNTAIRAADMPELLQQVCTLKLLRDFHRSFWLVAERAIRLWMHVDFLHNFSSNHKEILKLRESFRFYANKLHELRKKKISNYCSRNLVTSDHIHGARDNSLQNSIIDTLLTSQLTEEEIMEEIIIIMIACEEAATAIGAVLMLMGQFPAVQEKVYKELQDIYGDSDRPVEKDDLANMQYLDLVIKEAFRLFPPVPLIGRRAHKETKLSSGRVIPRRSGVVIPIIAIHRNPKYWGDTAEHFDPERFLPERIAGIPDGAYIPFSHGPRSCVGYKFASYQVKLALCAILRKYKVVGEVAPGPVPNIPTKIEVTTRAVDDFLIQLVHRT